MKGNFIFLLAVLLLSAVPAMAANRVQLEWDFSFDEESNISGFSIYMRTDGGEYPDDPVATPAADERLVEIPGLDDGTYWFCIAAVISVNGSESSRSGEAGITFDNGEISYPFSVTSPTILRIQGTPE